MPRLARQKSPTEIYHVMVRGINRDYIFETDENNIIGDGSFVCNIVELPGTVL